MLEFLDPKLTSGIFATFVMMWTVYHLWQLARPETQGPPTRKLGFGAYILLIGLWNIRLAYVSLQGYAPPPSSFLGIFAMFPVTFIFEFFFPSPPIVSDQAKKTN